MIIKKIMQYQENPCLKTAMYIIKNLYVKSFNHLLYFHSQIQIQNKPTFRGKKPVYVSQIDPKFELCFRCMQKNLPFYEALKNTINKSSLKKDVHKLLTNLQRYSEAMFKKNNQFDQLKEKIEAYIENDSKLDSKMDYNVIINVLYSHLYTFQHQFGNYSTNKKSEFKNIYISVTDDELEQQELIESIHVDQEKNPIRMYRVLKHKRLEQIPCYNQLFHTAFNNSDYNRFIDIYFMNWESLARNSPLWSVRFNQYNAYFNAKHRIIFENEDNYEEFYEAYNYEPDEQSWETTYKSFPPPCPKEEITMQKYIEKLYETSPEKINIFKSMLITIKNRLCWFN